MLFLRLILLLAMSSHYVPHKLGEPALTYEETETGEPEEEQEMPA